MSSDIDVVKTKSELHSLYWNRAKEAEIRLSHLPAKNVFF